MLEGGGQVLRMATTYSALLGMPARIFNIRARRSPPGLRPQHLTTLKAVANICRAETRGLNLGSKEVAFHPGPPVGGSYEIDIKTAGSITLLLQCLVPVAAFSSSPSKFRITGGTNVRWSPPMAFLENVIWKAFRQMGFEGCLKVRREGFYPRGGGVVDVRVEPVKGLSPLQVVSRGDVEKVRGVSICERLPKHVAERQARSARGILEASLKTEINVRAVSGADASFSPGSVICLWVEAHPNVFMGSSALGERGKPAERVGREAASALLDEVQSGAAVDKHTADNLVLWCSLASGESEYTMSRSTLHTETAVEIARMFTGADIQLVEEAGGTARFRCCGIGLES